MAAVPEYLPAHGGRRGAEILTMRVLLSASPPYAWAHGGVHVLVENLRRALTELGVEIDNLRWWDEDQRGDVLLAFHPITTVEGFARARGLHIVNYVFLDGYSDKSNPALWARLVAIRALRRLSPYHATQLGWNFPALADAMIYPSEGDRRLAAWLYGSDPARGHVIPYGVDERILRMNTERRDGEYLLSMATIHPRKNTVLLAKAARETKTPIVFLGRPYVDDDYSREFQNLVDGRFVIYQGHVTEEEKRRWLTNARGFVSWSRAETGCIAVTEALAAGCPVLLPRFRWAVWNYEKYATLVPGDWSGFLTGLAAFFKNPPPRPRFPALTWVQVAERLLVVLQKLERGQ